MPSSPTTRNRLEKQAVGENVNTWGDKLNQTGLDLIDEAMDGVTTIAIASTAVTLTSSNYATDQSRKRVLVFTGTLTGNTAVTVPSVEKLYEVDDQTTRAGFTLTLKTSGGTGYALRPGPQQVYCDATDVRRGTPRLDQLPLPTGSVDMNAQRLTNLPTPSANSDAATKKYVDDTAFSSASGSLPGQTGNAGRVLTTNGSVAGWGAILPSPAASDRGKVLSGLTGGGGFEVRQSSEAYWGGTAGGTANALTATTGMSLSSLAVGQVVGVKVGASANGGAATLAVDGVGAIAIRKDGSALVGGELAANTDRYFMYDGTYLRMLGGAGGVASFLSVGLKTGAYTVTTADAGKLIPCSGTWQLSLLAAAQAQNGFTLAIYNGGTGVITVKPNGAEVIGGAGAVTISAGGSLIVVCDGTAWYPIGTVTSSTMLDSANKGSSITLSNSNLTAINSTGTWSCVRANTAITAGKWYLECRQDVLSSPTRTMFGVAASSVTMADGSHIGGANCWSLSDAGQLSVNGSGTASWSSAWGSVGSVVGMYIDATTLSSIKIWFALNNVLIASGDPATGANPAATITGSPTLYPAVALITSQQVTTKFSKSSWQYTPVTGYNALP